MPPSSSSRWDGRANGQHARFMIKQFVATGIGASDLAKISERVEIGDEIGDLLIGQFVAEAWHCAFTVGRDLLDSSSRECVGALHDVIETRTYDFSIGFARVTHDALPLEDFASTGRVACWRALCGMSRLRSKRYGNDSQAKKSERCRKMSHEASPVSFIASMQHVQGSLRVPEVYGLARGATSMAAAFMNEALASAQDSRVSRLPCSFLKESRVSHVYCKKTALICLSAAFAAAPPTASFAFVWCRTGKSIRAGDEMTHTLAEVQVKTGDFTK